MPQKTLAEVWDDPKFRGANPEVQRAVLGKLGVSGDRVDKLLAKLAGPSTAATDYDKYLASGGPTSVQREPGKGVPASFLARMQSRVGEQVVPAIQALGNPLKAADYVSSTLKEMEFRARNPEEGRKRSAEEWKRMWQTYKDPANIAGDVAAGAVFGETLKAPGERSPVVERSVARTRPAPAVPEVLRPTEPALTAEQHAKYADDLAKAYHSYSQEIGDYAEKEAQRRSKWVQKAYGAKKSVADQVAAANKRDILQRGSDEYTRLAQENIHLTHEAVRGSLDARWGSLRDAMRNTEIAQPEDIYNGIKDAEAKYLRGSPQSLQQFRNLIKEMGIKDYAEGEDDSLTAVAADETESPKPMDWETGRVHYSAIGDRLSSGNLPGNVYQALKAVSQLLDEKLGEAAEQSGRGDEYDSLKRDWSEYMKDWRDTSSVAGGGSPLAKALVARDPGFVRLQVAGKAGDRMVETMAKYKRHGARPELAVHARRLAIEAKAMPAVKVRPMPPEYEPLPAPKLKEVPVPSPKPKSESAKPSPSTAPRGVKLAGRIGGGVVGGIAGAKVGHPWLGFGGGAKAGEWAVERLYRGKNKVQSPARPPVPPAFDLPD